MPSAPFDQYVLLAKLDLQDSYRLLERIRDGDKASREQVAWSSSFVRQSRAFLRKMNALQKRNSSTIDGLAQV
jgi:hypothetical protein